MTDWWAGLAPAEARLTCGGDQHRLAWREGELRAPDHADPDAERTLAALGGERCACVEMLDAWHAHASDLRVLVLGSRGLSDPLAAPRDAGTGVSGGLLAGAGPRGPVRAAAHRTALFHYGSAAVARVMVSGGPAAGVTPGGLVPDPDAELAGLLGLGGGLPARLAATVAAAWAARLEGLDRPDTAGPAVARLHAALAGRATAALRTWLGDPALPVDVRMTDGSAEPLLARVGDGLRAELPFGWLSRVWARDLAVVAGRFCLAAEVSAGRWRLSVLDPAIGPPQRLSIELAAGG